MSRFSIFIIVIFFALKSFGKEDLTIEIDGKIKIPSKKLVLNSGFHEILFRFSSNNNSIKRYQFYLKNLEIDWKNSDFPVIRYTNLGGGNYTFHGRVLKGNIIIRQFRCEIEIKENFWEKWWFWLFVVFFVLLFIGLSIYFWFLYDFRQRMKTEQIRQRIASDLHDEIGANLSSINFLVGSLQKKIKGNDKDLHFFLEKISDNSTESATLINDTIWALNPAFDTFEKLVERIKSFASGLLSSKDIAFTIENNLTEKNVELSIEQRRNLYFIMKEAINNIAKHSDAKKTFLIVSKSKNGIIIEIEDDGRGYDLNDINDGNGLKNIQKRVEDSNFVLKTETEIGKGTKLCLYLLSI